MTRRAFITLLSGAATWPLASRAQGRRGRPLAHIGVLTVGSTTAEMIGPAPQSEVVKAFLGGMSELGYVHGRDS
jgi:putative tryptophan/tyrosine transport system substrate-binding protein